MLGPLAALPNIFAVILPETATADAHRVAGRISHRLADDRDGPVITASIGVAVYPNDGLDKESLISAAHIILL